MSALLFLLLFAILEILKTAVIILLLIAFGGAAIYLVVLSALAVFSRENRA